jgi:predicted kinase
MDKIKEYFSKGFYSNVWDDICSAHHGVVQGDLDGTDNNRLVTLNPYHHESVLDHVYMVYENAVKTGDPNVELLASAHDVAKPFMRYYNKDNNRVRFSGHEYASALFSINFLREQGITGRDLVSFLKILTLHVASYHDNACDYDLDDGELELLRALNTVDNAGRICAEPRELDFKNWEPVHYLKKAECDNPFVIMIGLPGSGKSTYTESFQGKVFSTDAYLMDLARVMFTIEDDYNKAFTVMSEKKINWVGKCTDLALKHFNDTGEATLYDATNLTKKKRSNIAKRARKLGAHVKYVMVWRDFSECVECRSSDEKSIPRGVFKRMLSSFTYPKKSEYDSIEHVVV